MPNEIRIPAEGGKNVQISTNGKPIFILGRNGAGKSALVHYIRQQVKDYGPQNLVYLPGSRPSYFDHERLSMTAASRQDLEKNSFYWDGQPDARVKLQQGSLRNERAIFDLLSSIIQYNSDVVDDLRQNGQSALSISKVQSRTSPLDRVNNLLRQANLPVQLEMEYGEIRSRRDGNTYSISKMSDGERIALILISEVISARPGSFFLIDEPELHLHRAIVVPLISALMTERSDCTMLVSTHELDLPSACSDSTIILVRGCLWNGPTPALWDVDILENAEEIPEDVRVDLLGSRRKILFVEGTSTSLDQPFYALLFPNISVRQRESCAEVGRAVGGLRQVRHLHHAEVFGLVDNDSMSAEHKEKLRKNGIFALPIFSVESLYYCRELLFAVAHRQSLMFGERPNELISQATEKAIAKLKQPGKAEHLAARVSERKMRDALLANMPSREDVISSGSDPIQVSILSPYTEILAKLQRSIEESDLDSIISAYPIRESGVLGDLARELHFRSETDYEKAVLTTLSSDETLRATIKDKLGALSSELE